MEFFDLNATVRDDIGTSHAKQLRRDGYFPAVLYGFGVDNRLLSIHVNEFKKCLTGKDGGHQFFTLAIQSDPSKEVIKTPVLLKELQRHPVSNGFYHADFYQVDMEKKIRVMVPVTTSGKAAGEDLGGTAQIIRRELEVLCLPMDIPDTILIDIDDLNIGDSIHIDDIDPGKNVELPHDINFTVITVLSPLKETEEETETEEDEEGEETAAETTDAAETDE